MADELSEESKKEREREGRNSRLAKKFSVSRNVAFTVLIKTNLICSLDRAEQSG